MERLSLLAPEIEEQRSDLSSHDRILLAARSLFSSDGYENTTTSAIARRAGTSESQLIKHFGSKEGLLEAILDRLQKLGGEEFRHEYQHELNTYRDVIKGAAPTRFLIRVIEERLAVHQRSIETARASEMIRIAEEDRAHPGKREELKDLFRRSVENARQAAGRR